MDTYTAPESWGSYPKILTLGHAGLVGLLDDPVVVEEKVDGSQFSFCMGEDGQIRFRSKGATIHPDAPDKMFANGVRAIREIADMLTPGWTYRGEYLRAPKHNALAYDRIPTRHVILFDVCTGKECYLGHDEKRVEAQRLGLECVPAMFSGVVSDIAAFRAFLETTSVLGGQKVEGVVVKQASVTRFGRDGKALIGKFVSDAFKEVHAKAWKDSNPGPNDIINFLGEKYRSQARWQKAAQRMAEAGTLEGSPRDIGPMLKLVGPDIREECEDEIKDALFRWAWPHIQRMAVRGLPEWWKEQLLARQFGGTE